MLHKELLYLIKNNNPTLQSMDQYRVKHSHIDQELTMHGEHVGLDHIFIPLSVTSVISGVL